MSEVKEKHWGEFGDSSDDPWGDHSFMLSDYEELLPPQLHPPSSTSLHQPSPQLTSSFQILSGESTRSDVTVQNTIRLLQHTRHVSHLINRAQNLSGSGSSSGNSNSNGSGDLPPSSLPACPPLPAEIALSRPPLSHQTLNFLPPQSTPFTAGQESGLCLEVQHGTARKMLRQAVALVLAHAGFTDSTDTVLRTLADLVHDFMTKFTKTFRVNADTATLNLNYCPFHDVLEQTMKEMNIGGLLDLHKMYTERVQNYHANVKDNAVQLTNHYNMLLIKQQQQPTPPPSQQQQQQHVAWPTTPGSNTTTAATNSTLALGSASTPFSTVFPTAGASSTNTTTAATNSTLALGSGSAPFSTVFPTAGGGSINITIGAIPGSTGINFPNLTASSSPDEGGNVEAIGGRGRVNSGATRSNSGGGQSSGSTPSNIINLEQELSRHYAPLNAQSDADGRNQNSPLATHFTINPR